MSLSSGHAFAQSAIDIAADAGRKFELQLQMLEDARVTIISSDGLKTQSPATLKAGSTIMVGVPNSMNLSMNLNDLSSIDLNKVVENLGTGQTQDVVVGTVADKKQRRLINETARVNLSDMVKKGKVRLERVEQVEDTEITNVTEGSVECLTKDCPGDSSSKTKQKSNIEEVISKFKDNISRLVASYESSSEVQELMSTVKQGYTARNRGQNKTTIAKAPIVSGSIGACYNGVKTALLRSGLVDRRLVGVAAKNAGQEVEKEFINLMNPELKYKIKSPKDAPKGSVLVYEGHKCSKADSNCKYGHIEIKTESGFISDYYSPNARTGDALEGKGRKLIGVYIKGTKNNL